MDHSSDSDAKINVFALPNQTNILAGLIASVLLGALWIGCIDPSPIPIWPFALAFSVLPLRMFLSRPAKDHERHHPFFCAQDFPDLNRAIEENSRKIGLKQSPRLWVSRKIEDIYARGSFRRWYVCINADLAKKLSDQLNSPDMLPITEARILHELFHFKAGDYWRLGLVEDLVKTTFWGMAWAYTLLLGWGFLLVLATQSFFQTTLDLLRGNTALPPGMGEILFPLLPSVEEVIQLREKAAGINMGLVLSFISSSLMPFIILSGVLWIFYRPKLWRMRESYADAGVVQTQNQIRTFRRALVLGSGRNTISEHQVGESSLNMLWRSLCSKFDFGFRHHSPNAIFRLVAVRKPHIIYDDWIRVAILLGTLTLSLDILLASTPLTQYYVGALPMHFTTLVILATVSLSMLPWIVQGNSVAGVIVKAISLIMGLRLIWLLLTIGLLIALYVFAPNTLAQFLSEAVSITARYAGQQSVGFDDVGEFILEASFKNLAIIVIVFMVLIMSLLIVSGAFRRLLTWYSLPQAKQRAMRVAYMIIGWMFLIVWWLVLPLSTGLLLNPSSLMTPLFGVQSLVAMVVLILGIVAFVRADYRYSKRCPKCHQEIKGWYQLGKTCPNDNCSQRLNEWLIADYASDK